MKMCIFMPLLAMLFLLNACEAPPEARAKNEALETSNSVLFVVEGDGAYRHVVSNSLGISDKAVLLIVDYTSQSDQREALVFYVKAMENLIKNADKLDKSSQSPNLPNLDLLRDDISFFKETLKVMDVVFKFSSMDELEEFAIKKRLLDAEILNTSQKMELYMKVAKYFNL